MDVLQDASVQATLINLGLALVMGQVLAWHFVRYAQVLSNKRKFARIFVFIACTTLLMITVVKTSLALSLGLVGALSIIRFRTPIKEPEELAYLFLAIAIGVGLGADQILPTLLIFTVLLLVLALFRGRRSVVPVRTLLQVSISTEGSEAGGGSAAVLEQLLPTIEAPCDRVDVQRVDVGDGRLDASLAVELAGAQQLSDVIAAIEARFAGASVTFIERDRSE